MKSIFFNFIFLLLFININAQSLNNSYSFFIAGHTYGKPGTDNIGLHPPFKAKFEYIQNRPEIKFGILTGDIVKPSPVAQDWDEVDADIDSLGLPVFFAVGNHDMEDRPLYESRYGITYYHFVYENDLFIILDPNIDGWSIRGEQFDFLENVIENNHQAIDNIFVFVHQIIWRTDDNIYSSIHPNSFSGLINPTNFWTEIEPIFHELENQVVFFGGDLGAGSWSTDFMYDQYDNITFIGSGMGEGIGDNFVIINVDSLKNLNYDLICLNDTSLNCFGELTDYQMTQPCFPNGIIFNTQSEIDHFQQENPYCTKIEGDVIISGTDIISLTGLAPIVNISGKLQIKENPNLINLNGLINLLSIGDTLEIIQNANLNNIEGLDSVRLENCSYIEIKGNPLLSTCNISNLCNYIDIAQGEYLFVDNALGCNHNEVSNSCASFVINDDPALQSLIYPNPLKGVIHIELANSLIGKNNLSVGIFNSLGSQVDDFKLNQATNSIDISNYSSGLYFFVIKDQGQILETHKVMVE